MPRRNIIFLIVASAATLACVRLGVWQLQRLASRRALNAIVSSRLGEPPVPLSAVPRDTAERRYRHVRLAGTFDFAHEMALIDRVRDGAPGVDIITPLRPDSGIVGDTTVLVDRGWVYAADGMSVNHAQWREPAHVAGTGYLIALVRGEGPPVLSTPDRPNAYRWLERSAVERNVGHPIADYIVVLRSDTHAPAESSDTAMSAKPHAPARRPPPPLDEGPHMNYAIQWFSFALIIIVGTAYALFFVPMSRSHTEIAPRTT
jgi:surfeit locus 1 family protein